MPSAGTASAAGGRGGGKGGGRSGGPGAKKQKYGGFDGQPWKIAAKCVGGNHETDGGTPALALPLSDGDVYYMLDDFNHHHHHAVIAGSSGRYSSTHRVAVTSTDTYQYIRARLDSVLNAPPIRIGGQWQPMMAAELKRCEEVHTEVEMEWLRPWGVQGKRHSTDHGAYWEPRMAQMEEAWRRLEARTAGHVALLEAAAAAAPDLASRLLPEGVRCFDILEVQLTKREGSVDPAKPLGRLSWQARTKSSAYAHLQADQKPLDFPRFWEACAEAYDPPMQGMALCLPPEALQSTIAALRQHRAAFAQRQVIAPVASRCVPPHCTAYRHIPPHTATPRRIPPHAYPTCPPHASTCLHMPPHAAASCRVLPRPAAARCICHHMPPHTATSRSRADTTRLECMSTWLLQGAARRPGGTLSTSAPAELPKPFGGASSSPPAAASAFGTKRGDTQQSGKPFQKPFQKLQQQTKRSACVATKAIKASSQISNRPLSSSRQKAAHSSTQLHTARTQQQAASSKQQRRPCG